LKAGFDCYEPLEVKAGMDLVDLKKNFGEVATFMAGLMYVLWHILIRRLLKKKLKTKIPIAKKGGGYIFHSDHSVHITSASTIRIYY